MDSPWHEETFWSISGLTDCKTRLILLKFQIYIKGFLPSPLSNKQHSFEAKVNYSNSPPTVMVKRPGLMRGSCSRLPGCLPWCAASGPGATGGGITQRTSLVLCKGAELLLWARQARTGRVKKVGVGDWVVTTSHTARNMSLYLDIINLSFVSCTIFIYIYIYIWVILHEMPIMHLLLSVGLYEAHAFVYWFVFIHPFIHPSIYQSTINLSINLSTGRINQSTIIYRSIYPNLSTVINSCLQSCQLQGSSKSQAHPPRQTRTGQLNTRCYPRNRSSWKVIILC